MSDLGRVVARVGRWLDAIYGLDLELRPEDYIVDPAVARSLLPRESPRSGLLVLEENDALWLGLYVDPSDRSDAGTIIEETSHLLCLAWHAARDRPVTRLVLELQAEVDRYVVARLTGRDAFRHFEHFSWAGWMGAAARARYEAAHHAAHRYCRGLSGRFPRRADTPNLFNELRHFYRASPQGKLRATAA